MEIKATDIKMGKALSTRVYHYTGGLCGIPIEGGGIAIGPVDAENGELIYHTMTASDAKAITDYCGMVLVGINQRYEDGSYTRAEVWRPPFKPTLHHFDASDMWGLVSGQAHKAGNKAFADLSRYFSVTLRAAGIRLRDIARAHQEQLEWALLEKRPLGNRFANIAMSSLHLAFHGALGELFSARDYLAAIAANLCGAKASVNGMARLEDWLGKSANASYNSNPMVALMMAAMGSVANPGWLRVLGEMRNTMMHREPMGASSDSQALTVTELLAPKGRLRAIRLVPATGAITEPDPFLEVVNLYRELDRLATAAVGLAPYPPDIPVFVGN